MQISSTPFTLREKKVFNDIVIYIIRNAYLAKKCVWAVYIFGLLMLYLSNYRNTVGGLLRNKRKCGIGGIFIASRTLLKYMILLLQIYE